MKLDRSDMFVVDGIRRTGVYSGIGMKDHPHPDEKIPILHLFKMGNPL